MKKYEIESFHYVCDIHYLNGESDEVGSYDSIQTIYASDIDQAIDSYLEKNLYTELRLYDLDLNLENNCYECSFLQTSYGYEASIEEIELWDIGQLKLQSNSFQLKISEVVEIKLK